MVVWQAKNLSSLPKQHSQANLMVIFLMTLAMIPNDGSADGNGKEDDDDDKNHKRTKE